MSRAKKLLESMFNEYSWSPSPVYVDTDNNVEINPESDVFYTGDIMDFGGDEYDGEYNDMDSDNGKQCDCEDGFCSCENGSEDDSEYEDEYEDDTYDTEYDDSDEYSYDGYDDEYYEEYEDDMNGYESPEFDDLDDPETVDYPSQFFPDLHYPKIDNYYNQVSGNPNMLTDKSCQMCGQGEKMHGVRYCRSCYDKMRYRKRKILNGSFSTLTPFSINRMY